MSLRLLNLFIHCVYILLYYHKRQQELKGTTQNKQKSKYKQKNELTSSWDKNKALDLISSCQSLNIQLIESCVADSDQSGEQLMISASRYYYS